MAIPTQRFATGHSAPMLLNADRLPEILTARELEGFIRIDVKTIYAYVKGGDPLYADGVESPLLQAGDSCLARGAALPAIAGGREICSPGALDRMKVPLASMKASDPRREKRYGQPPRVARTESKTKKAPRRRSGPFIFLQFYSQHQWTQQFAF